MKTSSLVSAVLGLVLLSSAGCAKSTDLGKMQEETIATVKIYLGEVDVLQRRYDELVAKKAPSTEAGKLLESANQAITTARTTAASAPTAVAAAAKSGNADAVTEQHYAIIAKIENSIENATSSLASYENLTANAAVRPAPITEPTPTPAPTPTPDMPVSNDGAAPAGKMPAGPTPAGHTTEIPCTAEIALQCPDGQVDACTKGAANHACVAK